MLVRYARLAPGCWAATGNARRLVCLSGGTITPCDAHSQDAFGRMWGNPAQQPYRWGAAWGYLRDPSELVQLGARWYWPELGRFIQQDPARDGVNWYAYVENNPLTGVDPEGLDSLSGEVYFRRWWIFGPGGSGTIGRDPGPGGYGFIGAHSGVGTGGGFEYDPHGASPGFSQQRCNRPGLGFTIGASANLNISVGPINIIKVDAQTGWRRGPDTGYAWQRYRHVGPSKPTVSEPPRGLLGKIGRAVDKLKKLLKIRATANVGTDVYVYGRFPPF